MYYTKIILSILNFTVLFGLLTLILSFWGRKVLKLVNVKEYGQMLPMVTGWASLVFLAQALFPFIHNYSIFLNIFYFIGLIGVLIEFFIFYLNHFKYSKCKYSLLKRIVVNNDSFIAIILLAIIFSFLYSAIWPSAQIDVWMDTSVDYFIWIFLSEYLVEGVKPEVLEIHPVLSHWIQDAFGTHLFIAFAALSFLKSPLLASSAVSVTLLVWWSGATYSLLKKIFGFKFPLTLILTLSVALGWLFNYLAIYGMFGHLIAMTLYLTTLEQLLISFKNNYTFIKRVKILFFPLLLLLMSYPGGYIPISLLIIFTGFLIVVFSLKNHFWWPRFTKAMFHGLVPVLAVTSLLALLSPGVFYYMGARMAEISTQTTGWRLPFFKPWLLSGLPYYSVSSLSSTEMADGGLTSILSYLPIFFTLIILMIISIKFNSKELLSQKLSLSKINLIIFQQKTIISLIIVYLTCLICYLIAYLNFGHSYKVWKFAAYTVLPLSFIPIALAVSALFKISRDKLHYLPNLIIIGVISFFGIQFIKLPTLTEIPSKYYRMNSAVNFIKALENIKENLPKNSTLIVDLLPYHQNIITSIIFSNDTSYKLKFTKSLFLLFYSLNYYKSFSYNTFILSDNIYDGIINAKRPTLSSGNFIIYDFISIKNQGFAAIQGNNLNEDRLIKYNQFNWKINNFPIYATFLIPNNKINKNLLLIIKLKRITDSYINCKKSLIGVFRKNNSIEWSQYDIENLSIPIPAEITTGGILKIILSVGDSPKVDNIKFNEKIIDIKCNFEIDSFDLIEDIK
ncbi:MAG: hypothetical protein LBT86_10420 [Deltaproteobacteria bacterium]|jgi:hypothetical protein|nr:hypothetical protein [Deltaproteobacteria bacterium]